MRQKIDIAPMTQRFLLRSIAVGLFCCAFALNAQSTVIKECDISFEKGRFDGSTAWAWAIRFCDVRDSIYKRWEPKLQALDTGWQSLSTARSAGDWKAYRLRWLELLPLMKDLEAEALANRDVPGAEQLLKYYHSDLGFVLFQSGFGKSTGIDLASARIMAGLDVPRAGVAAGIGVEAVLESKRLGQWFVMGLASVASEKIQNEYRIQARQRPERVP